VGGVTPLSIISLSNMAFGKEDYDFERDGLSKDKTNSKPF
jgi:hypothetical protein